MQEKIIGMIFFIMLQVGFSYYHTKEIEKHSVHPQYGNYMKFDVNGCKCSPWDDCDGKGARK